MFTRGSYIALVFSALFLAAANCPANDYILYVRPRGSLGKEFKTYWDAVKSDSDISHKAITDYPPHCSLTGFFPANQPEKTYIQAVSDAIKSQGSTPGTITIVGLVQGKQTSRLDYVKLSSSYLLNLTRAFMTNASVPQHYLKDPQSFPYHITLRDHVFKQNVVQKMAKIQKLEKKIDLHAKASWSIFLYERDTKGDLTAIKEFPLDHQ